MPSGSRERHGRSRYRRRKIQSTAAALRRRRGAGAAWVGEAMRPQFKARRLSTLPGAGGNSCRLAKHGRRIGSELQFGNEAKNGDEHCRVLWLSAPQETWHQGRPEDLVFRSAGWIRARVIEGGEAGSCQETWSGAGLSDFFARRRAVLNCEIQKLRESMAPDAILWISW